MSSDCDDGVGTGDDVAFDVDPVPTGLAVGSSDVGALDGLLVLRGAASVGLGVGASVVGAFEGAAVGSAVVGALEGAIEVGDGVAAVGLFVGSTVVGSLKGDAVLMDAMGASVAFCGIAVGS